MGDSREGSEAPQVSNSVDNCQVYGSVFQFRDQYAIDATELAKQFVAAQQAAREEKERQERTAALEAELQAHEAEKLQAARQAWLLRQQQAKEAERRRAGAAEAAKRKQAEAKRKEREDRVSCVLALVGLVGVIGFCWVSGFPWPIGVFLYFLLHGWLTESSN